MKARRRIMSKGSRSRLVSETTAYLIQLRRRQMEENLKSGYLEMASINCALAEEGLVVDNESYILAAGRRVEAD